jgi:hypothetical protein
LNYQIEKLNALEERINALSLQNTAKFNHISDEIVTAKQR